MNRLKDRLSLSYSDRAELSSSNCGKKLFELMEEKKTNLTFAVDIPDSQKVLRLSRDLGEEIAVLKTHIDILPDYCPAFIEELKDLSKDFDFLLFEDRKFIDIGNTVKLQYSCGFYNIANWAHITNAHALPGPGVIDGLYEVAKPMMKRGLNRGIVLLAQMTSKGTLATGEYTEKTVAMANKYPEYVMGFIGAGSVPSDLNKLASMAELHQIIMTPGVKMGARYGALGQRYAGPEEAVAAGSDNIIVGSGIYETNDPIEAARKYREIGWEAYITRMK